jgi:hypothetical protein
MFSAEFTHRIEQRYRIYRALHWVQNIGVSTGVIATSFFVVLYDSKDPATHQLSDYGATTEWLTVLLFLVCLVARRWLATSNERAIWREYLRVNGSTTIDAIVPGFIDRSSVLTKGAREIYSARVIGGKFKAFHTFIGTVSTHYEMQPLLFKPNSYGSYGFKYLVLAIELDKKLPHLFIDGRRQNRLTRKNRELWSLTKKLHPKQKLIDLEGDFYKYFAVYAANRKHIEALSILTPDTMLALRDQGYDFDYEIYGRWLYVIREPHIRSVAELEAFFQAAEGVLTELVPQLARQQTKPDGTTLTVRTTNLAIWAIIYSLAAIGYYLFLIFGLFLVGTAAGMYVLEH